MKNEQESSEKYCPKCGNLRRLDYIECLYCGIIYDKYKKAQNEENQKVDETALKKNMINFPLSLRIKKIYILLLILLFTSIIIFYFDKETKQKGELTGQIFIVNNDLKNIKFGGVEVLIFKEADIKLLKIIHKEWMLREFLKIYYERKNSLKQLKKLISESLNDGLTLMPGLIQEAKKTCDSSQAQLISMSEASFYFQKLPPNLYKTETDADGKFSIKIPINGKFILAAKVSTEGANFDWLLPISLNGEKYKNIIVNNNNVSDSVYAKYFTESSLYNAVKKASIVDNGDGTITDKYTYKQGREIIWKKCNEGQTGQECTGEAKKMNWEEAVEFAKKANKWWEIQGYNGWRLPTLEELDSLVIENEIPAYDKNLFINNNNTFIWSNTCDLNNKNAYGMYTFIGTPIVRDKTSTYNIRLVKDNKKLKSLIMEIWNND